LAGCGPAHSQRPHRVPSAAAPPCSEYAGTAGGEHPAAPAPRPRASLGPAPSGRVQPSLAEPPRERARTVTSNPHSPSPAATDGRRVGPAPPIHASTTSKCAPVSSFRSDRSRSHAPEAVFRSCAGKGFAVGRSRSVPARDSRAVPGTNPSRGMHAPTTEHPCSDSRGKHAPAPTIALLPMHPTEPAPERRDQPQAGRYTRRAGVSPQILRVPGEPLPRRDTRAALEAKVRATASTTGPWFCVSLQAYENCSHR
jgi:hypothetical protein